MHILDIFNSRTLRLKIEFGLMLLDFLAELLVHRSDGSLRFGEVSIREQTVRRVV